MTDPSAPREIPLFPLQTVLYPGGRLLLRIFEQRYLDMVKHCTGKDLPFGVCLIAPGSEAGDPASPHAVGTTARIVDWYTLDDGLLGIAAVGERRFRAGPARTNHQGLLTARVHWLTDSAPAAVDVDHALLVQMLSRILEQVRHQHPEYDLDVIDDRSWVGYRLCELLPLDLDEKQRLLEIDDPRQRLGRLLEIIPELQDD